MDFGVVSPLQASIPHSANYILVYLAQAKTDLPFVCTVVPSATAAAARHARHKLGDQGITEKLPKPRQSKIERFDNTEAPKAMRLASGKKKVTQAVLRKSCEHPLASVGRNRSTFTDLRDAINHHVSSGYVLSILPTGLDKCAPESLSHTKNGLDLLQQLSGGQLLES